MSTPAVNQTNVEINKLYNQPWKQCTLLIVMMVQLLTLVVLCLALFNRTYTPFKSKQLPFLGVGYFAGLCFTLSNLQIFEIVDQVGIFADCTLWFLWMQVVFGGSLILIIMSARMLRLYFLIVLAKPAQGIKFWSPLALMYLPSWALALLATVFPNKYEASAPEVTTATIDGVPGCTVQLNQLWFLYALYGVVLLQLCFVWVLTILVSRVRMGFNEFKENVTINTIATVSLFASYGLVITAISFHNWGKIVLLFLSVLFATISTIGPLFKVTIGFLKNKEEYLVKWKRGLRDERLPTGLNYSVGETTSSGNGHGSMIMSSYRSSTQKSYM